LGSVCIAPSLYLRLRGGVPELLGLLGVGILTVTLRPWRWPW
jgi:hypothetical protein